MAGILVSFSTRPASMACCLVASVSPLLSFPSGNPRRIFPTGLFSTALRTGKRAWTLDGRLWCAGRSSGFTTGADLTLADPGARSRFVSLLVSFGWQRGTVCATTPGPDLRK